MCEMILRDFTVACGLRHIALRYFNASGADSTPGSVRSGQWKPNSSCVR